MSASPRPIARLEAIQVDCPDPDRLAPFWAEVLGVGIDERLGEPPQYVTLLPAAPGGPRLSFQRVPEAKLTKNRVHLDLVVDDVEEASARVASLGGRRRDDHDWQFREDGLSWRRMADPDDNEFCLLFRR